MNLEADLNKILEAFNSVKENLENNYNEKELLMLEKEKAVKNLDIEKLKELNNKLKNFD